MTVTKALSPMAPLPWTSRMISPALAPSLMHALTSSCSGTNSSSMALKIISSLFLFLHAAVVGAVCSSLPAGITGREHQPEIL
jgi:hypothetical protein